jgi:hypothetical protein
MCPHAASVEGVSFLAAHHRGWERCILSDDASHEGELVPRRTGVTGVVALELRDGSRTSTPNRRMPVRVP